MAIHYCASKQARITNQNIGSAHHRMTNMASSINTDFTQANNHNHNHNHNQPDINLTALSRSSSSSTASSSVLPPLPDLPNSLVSAPLQPTPSSTSSRPTSQHSHTHSPSSSLNRSHKRRFSSLTVAQDRAASENVAPFINKHSPHTLNPGTGIGALSTVMSSKPMYCNRHRPEFKCWRQANEPTMEELQTVSFSHVLPTLQLKY